MSVAVLDVVPDRPVLLTGASGGLGRLIAHGFAELGWPLRLTDIAPFPGPIPAGAEFVQADLTDGAATLRLAEGCGTIVHFAGIPVEQPFETVIGPNIRGHYHVYEAARREGAKVVYASSHHVAGFHERATPVGADCDYRPDGYYGLSKVYGEMTARLYWDKHGITSVMLRLGSCRPAPTDDRMLATWLSPGDTVSLAIRSVLADVSGCLVVWGVSDNRRMTWWERDDRALIGWAPQDSADAYEAALNGVDTANPIAQRYQGGEYCARYYSRDDDEVTA